MLAKDLGDGTGDGGGKKVNANSWVDSHFDRWLPAEWGGGGEDGEGRQRCIAASTGDTGRKESVLVLVCHGLAHTVGGWCGFFSPSNNPGLTASQTVSLTLPNLLPLYLNVPWQRADE